MRDFEYDVGTRGSTMYARRHNRMGRDLSDALNAGDMVRSRAAAARLERDWQRFKGEYADDSDEDW